MPITTLDAKTALLILDLQKGIAGHPFLRSMNEMVEKANNLSRAFRARGHPVVIVVVDGIAPGRTDQPRRVLDLPDDFADLVPELDRQPDDIRITKKTPGAFARTGLEEKLTRLGVTQVVLIGVVTGTAVDSTARQAYELGFNVTLPLDAMTDVSSESHEYAISKVFPRLGETGSTQDVLDLLAQ